MRLYELIDGPNERKEDREALLKKQIHMNKHGIPRDPVLCLGAGDLIARITCQAREPYGRQRCIHKAAPAYISSEPVAKCLVKEVEIERDDCRSMLKAEALCSRLPCFQRPDSQVTSPPSSKCHEKSVSSIVASRIATRQTRLYLFGCVRELGAWFQRIDGP